MIDNRSLVPPWSVGKDARLSPGFSPSPADETAILAPEVSAVPVGFLLRFLVFVAVVSGLYCLYVKQLNDLWDIRSTTASLKVEVARLERDNAKLLIEVAEASAPEQIEAGARVQGMVPARPTRRVSLAPESERTLLPPATTAAPAEPPITTLQLLTWWRSLVARIVSN